MIEREVPLSVVLDDLAPLGLCLVGEVPNRGVSHCALWDLGSAAVFEEREDVLTVVPAGSFKACAARCVGPVLVVVDGEGEELLEELAASAKRAEPAASAEGSASAKCAEPAGPAMLAEPSGQVPDCLPGAPLASCLPAVLPADCLRFDARSCAEVLVAVRREGLSVSLRAIASHIESAIVCTSAWLSMLHAAGHAGNVRDLVDLSAREFDGCLAVVDADGRVCACTKDASYESVPQWLPERRQEGLAFARERAAQRGSGACGVRGAAAGKRLRFFEGAGVAELPLRVGGRQCGRLCFIQRVPSPLPKGTADKLGLLAAECALPLSHQGRGANDEARRRALLLDRLMEGREVDTMELARDSAAARLPLEGRYRLVLFGGSHNDTASTRSLTVLNLQARFPQSVPFTHAEEVLLLVSEQDASMKIGEDLAARLDELACQQGCTCYSSDVVGSLGMLWYAYEQVVSCRALESSIALARLPLSGSFPFSNRIFQFYESVTFFNGHKGVGLGFLNESYQIAPLQRVVAYDREHDTDDLVVLYCYLSLEQGITATAERLHMHRNNVRYRIDVMSRRYDFDFSDPFVRMRLLNDFRLLNSQSPDFAAMLVRALG